MLDVSNREKIETARNEAQQQKDGLETDLKKVRVEMLMSGHRAGNKEGPERAGSDADRSVGNGFRATCQHPSQV